MVLAAKTGWTEHFIRWELPLARGHAYFHTARIMEGEHTQWPGQTDAIDQWTHDVRQWARRTSSIERRTSNSEH